MWKIVYDPETLRVMVKKFVLSKPEQEEENTLYINSESKPRGWFVGSDKTRLIEKPVVRGVNLSEGSELITPDPPEPPVFKSKEKKEGQKELAIVRLIGIGDVIMTLPLLSVLREKLPDWYITYWTSPAGARVLYNNENIDNVKILDYQTPRVGMPPVPKEVTEYDAVINLINKFDFGAITWTRPRVDNIFLSASNQLVNILDSPLTPPIQFTLPKLEMTDEQTEYLIDFSSMSIPQSKQVIGCVISSHGDCRFWKQDKWIELANRMSDFIFIWFSDKKEEISVRLPKNIINTCGILTFEEYITLLFRCDSIVCPDTAAMHLAEMLRTPCLVLEGSTNLRFHIKYYNYVSGIKLKRPLKCQPCYDWQLKSDCFKQEDLPWCLNKMKVKNVEKKLRSQNFR